MIQTKHALFFDIDGTLVSFKTHEIPASTILALTQAKANGHRVFIATGRPPIIITNLAAIEHLIDGFVTINAYEDEILGIELPAKVALEITECEPGVRGDTVTNGGSKDATLETGLKIRVPLFIEKGEKVMVDTATGKYDKRA